MVPSLSALVSVNEHVSSLQEEVKEALGGWFSGAVARSRHRLSPRSRRCGSRGACSGLPLPMLLRTFLVVALVDDAGDGRPKRAEPSDCRSAATPATCGAAIDVPDLVEMPPLASVDVMLTPGAKRSTHEPMFAQDGFVSLPLVALTVRASATRAGDTLQALTARPMKLPLPAATATGTPAATVRRTASSTEVVRAAAQAHVRHRRSGTGGLLLDDPVETSDDALPGPAATAVEHPTGTNVTAFATP
jgi:hypothetical protein